MQLKESLSILKNRYPANEGGEKGKLVNEMLSLIKEKTDGFANVKGIGEEKVNMKPILQKEGIKPVDWRKHKGSFERSEADSVIWLANYLTGNTQKDDLQQNSSNDNHRIRKIKMLRLRAKAVQLKLKLIKQ